VAAGLRDGGFAGGIVLVGAEKAMPYERPHLSKGFLLGTVGLGDLPLRPAIQYRQLRVDLELGHRVADLGLEDHRVLLDDGKTLGWDLLCIATGSEARRLRGFEKAMYLRELPEAHRLRARIDAGEALSIAGAGFIGCEVAAAARLKGCAVGVFEALDQPLLRVLGPQVGAYLAGVHRERGVELYLNSDAPPGVDLVAVGSAPRVDMAARSGLRVDGGIVVDECGRTSVEGVFAAGDVARFFHPLFETSIRVEHFQTSQRMGFAVGRTMAGAPTPYTEAPWFWSDQYDLNLQYVGAGLPWDETVVRGKIGQPPFTVFYLSERRLIAAAGINDHHTVARARHVMEARAKVTKAQLKNRDFDLRTALA
jgi:3-phenylpropionate/trans-cinnamate dioxygenase ferredoxin reductase subunit